MVLLIQASFSVLWYASILKFVCTNMVTIIKPFYFYYYYIAVNISCDVYENLKPITQVSDLTKLR